MKSQGVRYHARPATLNFCFGSKLVAEYAGEKVTTEPRRVTHEAHLHALLLMGATRSELGLHIV